ncbi:glycoside hydrolase family 3 N-terminal domain-containing protein [Streptomyces sp. NPDC050658]|uniref:glycoside hydrolase family 3 N-terminal domain-containing protein n=1 Tax=unclassified Streptomyces TaxID=2593676 RepID=UPI003447C29A
MAGTQGRGAGRDGSDQAREAAVETALGALDLDAKARLLGGRDMRSLHALPEIGLKSLVMSDGPTGVRGVRWTADDPSVALPSPTALAATWDQDLARRAGTLLAQEARRKGLHVLLAPTVNARRRRRSCARAGSRSRRSMRRSAVDGTTATIRIRNTGSRAGRHPFPGQCRCQSGGVQRVGAAPWPGPGQGKPSAPPHRTSNP